MESRLRCFSCRRPTYWREDFGRGAGGSAAASASGVYRRLEPQAREPKQGRVGECLSSAGEKSRHGRSESCSWVYRGVHLQTDAETRLTRQPNQSQGAQCLDKGASASRVKMKNKFFAPRAIEAHQTRLTATGLKWCIVGRGHWP
jgi:hypothetical protein